MADQLIQLRHTTSATNQPDSADGTSTGLIAGEPAVCIATGTTKMWVGVDGVLANNRLLFSTVDTDTTVLGNTFLKLTGGSMTGHISTNQTTFTNTQLVTKLYVDEAVASGQLYQGVYDASTNDPDLTLTANHPTINGAFFTVSVGGTVPAGVPGVGGTVVNPGDTLVWNEIGRAHV